ncbi:uncharacterized protein RHOBADRAFT_67052, partial [Rhodotorula graminis WP1]
CLRVSLPSFRPRSPRPRPLALRPRLPATPTSSRSTRRSPRAPPPRSLSACRRSAATRRATSTARTPRALRSSTPSASSSSSATPSTTTCTSSTTRTTTTKRLLSSVGRECIETRRRRDRGARSLAVVGGALGSAAVETRRLSSAQPRSGPSRLA